MKDISLKSCKIIISILYALYFISVVLVHVVALPANNGMTERYGLLGEIISYFLAVAFVIGFFALCTAIQAALFHSKASQTAKTATIAVMETLKIVYSVLYFIILDGRNVIFYGNYDLALTVFTILEIFLFAVTAVTEIIFLIILSVNGKLR